jgi:hypothetical protein
MLPFEELDRIKFPSPSTPRTLSQKRSGLLDFRGVTEHGGTPETFPRDLGSGQQPTVSPSFQLGRADFQAAVLASHRADEVKIRAARFASH